MERGGLLDVGGSEISVVEGGVLVRGIRGVVGCVVPPHGRTIGPHVSARLIGVEGVHVVELRGSSSLCR